MYDYETYQWNEKYSIKNGIAATIAVNFTNNYFSLFAISVLGANNYQVGYISSLPQFIGMFGSLFGAIVLNRVEEKKKITTVSVYAMRLFFLLMALVIYFPHNMQIWFFVAFIGIMNFPGAFCVLAWQAFIGDLIAENRRNDFFSDRNRILTIVGMVATFIGGIVLQLFKKDNPLPYQLLFTIAFICGLIEAYYLLKHKEIVDYDAQKTTEGKKGLLDFKVFKNKPYLYFVICALVFNFAWQMAWPLYSIYQIKDAHATGLWISLFTVANQLAQIVSFKWWGKMGNKHGNLLMLFIASVGMGTTPLITILSTNLIYLTLTNLLTGLFLSGTVLLLFNELLNVSSIDERSSCISNYNILLSIVGFLAPQFGVLLLQSFGMTFAMTLSFILRTAGAFLFLILIRVLSHKHKAKNKLKLYI